MAHFVATPSETWVFGGLLSSGWCGATGTWKCGQAPGESQEEALHLEKPPSWWSHSRGLNLWAEMRQDSGVQVPTCTSHSHPKPPNPPSQSTHMVGAQWGPTLLDQYYVILVGEQSQHKKYHNSKTESIITGYHVSPAPIQPLAPYFNNQQQQQQNFIFNFYGSSVYFKGSIDNLSDIYRVPWSVKCRARNWFWYTFSQPPNHRLFVKVKIIMKHYLHSTQWAELCSCYKHEP